MKLFIGVDLGTSAAKLLLVEESGAIRKTVTKEYPIIYPCPGWAEQRLLLTEEGVTFLPNGRVDMKACAWDCRV